MEIWDILIMLAFVGIGLWSRAAKQKAEKQDNESADSEYEAMDFPLEDFAGEEAEEKTETPEPVRRVEPSAPKKAEPKPEKPLHITAEADKKENIRLKNATDARRAFIYSEIFKRKYD